MQTSRKISSDMATPSFPASIFCCLVQSLSAQKTMKPFALVPGLLPLPKLRRLLSFGGSALTAKRFDSNLTCSFGCITAAPGTTGGENALDGFKHSLYWPNIRNNGGCIYIIGKLPRCHGKTFPKSAKMSKGLGTLLSTNASAASHRIMIANSL